MSLMPIMAELSSKFIIGLLNSNLIFDYYREFVNCTVNIQINDIRQIPIVLPQREQLKVFELLVDKAISIKKSALEIDSKQTILTLICYLSRKRLIKLCCHYIEYNLSTALLSSNCLSLSFSSAISADIAEEKMAFLAAIETSLISLNISNSRGDGIIIGS